MFGALEQDTARRIAATQDAADVIIGCGRGAQTLHRAGVEAARDGRFHSRCAEGGASQTAGGVFVGGNTA